MKLRNCKQIEELEARVAKLEGKEELPILTDPMRYTDILGNEGFYYRRGSRIIFTAEYPPCGIDIVTSSLQKIGHVDKIAEVIGWSSPVTMGQCSLENETVLAQMEYSDILVDTHGILSSDKVATTITIPTSGWYNASYRKYHNAGDRPRICGKVSNFKIERE